jgi:hypothetical protein
MERQKRQTFDDGRVWVEDQNGGAAIVIYPDGWQPPKDKIAANESSASDQSASTTPQQYAGSTVLNNGGPALAPFQIVPGYN